MAGIVINGNDIKAVSLNGQNVTKISDGTNTLWENIEYNLNYMWMQNTSDEVGTFTLTKTGTPNATELYYSLDKFHWTALDLTQETNTVSVPAGGRIWFRGDNTNGFSASLDNILTMGMNTSYNVGGDIRSLISSTSFVSLSVMPAHCYRQLFDGDTNLVSAEQLEIHFETIPGWGLFKLFQNCTSLTKLPSFTEIKTVGERGMGYMCYGDTSITSVDLSSITSLSTHALSYLVNGCSSLNYIKSPNVSVWSPIGTETAYWVSGVSATGTFVKPSDLTVPTSSTSGVPSGWTVENYDSWLCFQDVSGSTNTLTLTKLNTEGTAPTVNLEYSTDKVNWTTWTESNNVRTYTIPANGKVYLRGVNTNGLCYNGRNCHTFSSTGNVRASGNIMTIADGTGERTIIERPFFARLFYQMTTLLTAPNFPSEGMSIGDSTLAGMYNGCTSLTTAPSVTISSISSGWSCSLMFNNCTSLTDASSIHLNATEIPTQGYDEMFFGCSGLITPPTITSSALTLSSKALEKMFSGCTSLTTAPNLNISTLTSTGTRHCYDLFRECSSLTDVTKVKLNATTLYSQSYHSAFWGCINLVTPPEIMATSYFSESSSTTNGSLVEMFYNCSKLNQIKVHFTSWDNSGKGTKNWTYGTKSSGTFYKPSTLPSTKNTSGNTSNPDYIPYNWTVTNI